MTTCSGPIKYKGKVIGSILGCEAKEGDLIVRGQIDSGMHPVYSSDGEVWLRDEPDNEEGWRIAQLVQSISLVGLSIDLDNGEGEVYLMPVVQAL